MWPPFFFGVIPTYGVLPYAMISQSVFQQFLIADKKWGLALIKSTDSQKNSVLHITARENDLSAMAVLMEHKVESYIKNVDGKTPMHLAAEMGHHK